MDPNSLRTPEAASLLREYRDVPESDLPHLAMQLSKKHIAHAAEIVTLLRLRQKATPKFSRAADLFFTSDGLEMACGERIAESIASRFAQILPPKSTIQDLTVGIGGNAIILARHFHVDAIDLDPTHLQFAEWNAAAYGVADNIRFILGRAEDHLEPADAFFIDPQRLRSGKTKTRSLANSAPDIFALLPRLLAHARGGCIKISPAFDDEELQQLPPHELEVISEDKTNKAALLWFGEFRTCDRRATILLKDGTTQSFSNHANTPAPLIASSAHAFLFEPNNAISKAHLVPEIAHTFALKKLNATSNLLTGDAPIPNTTEILRTFRILLSEPFSLRRLKETLTAHNVTRAEFLIRDFPEPPESLRKKLKLQEGGMRTIIITAGSNGKAMYYLTENGR